MPPGASSGARASFILGLVGVLVALGFSVVLSVQSIAGLTLPGCGPQSACAAATSSVFGKLPFIGWPVSHLGTAYFVGALALWAAGRRRSIGLSIWLYRLGFAVSAVYVGIILTHPEYRCPYCLGAHAGNLVLLIAAEWRRLAMRGIGDGSPTSKPLAQIAPWGGGFVAATVALLIAGGVVQRGFEASQEGERQASADELASRMAEQAAAAARSSAEPPAATPDGVSGDGAPGDGSPSDAGSPFPPPAVAFAGSGYSESNPFVGRHVKGPAEAAIRIVAFSGFQCADCKRIDADIMRAIAQHPGKIAYTHKHFPFHTDCNPFTPRTLHDNACWAARVAEVAGMLGGSEAFFKMHDWLYEVDGRFVSNDDLRPGVARAGLEWSAFAAALNDAELMAEVNRRIEADVREGIRLGLNMTPMVFINGVELRGFRAPGAVVNTVSAALRSGPPPLGFGVDRPIGAMEKAIEVFLEDAPQSLPPSPNAFPSGPVVGGIDVQMWGSHARDEFREALRALRGAQTRRGDVSITIRHYPLDRSCNPHMSGGQATNECEMARLLDAAGIVGGGQAFWALSDWLVVNGERYTLDAALGVLRDAGVDVAAVSSAMADPARTAHIRAEIETLRRHMRVQGVPGIFINGRHATIWRGGEREPIIDELIEAAAGAGLR